MLQRSRKIFGTVTVVVLMIFGAACVVAVPEGPRGPVNVPPPPPPGYGMDEDYGVFYDGLAPYGDWFWLDPYGWVWDPAEVAPGWRPYTVGRWIYTEDGWFWNSEEPWGWATCHYGRWLFEPYRGWIWVPGHEWAPAWVAWRHGSGWVGWAPLPPRAVFRAEIGLDLGGVDLDVIIEPFWWGFVEEREIFEPRIYVRMVPVARNVTLVRATRNVTSYAVVRNRVVVRGADLSSIERATRRTVTPYRVVDEPSRGTDRHAKVVGRDLRVFRPAMKDAPPSRTPHGAAPHGVPAPEMESPGPAVGTRPRREQPAEAPPPRVVPEPPAPVPLDVAVRQHAEARDLERRQAAERARLERMQQKETRTVPAVAPPSELKKRHDEELRAMEEQTKREKVLLERKQERERQAKGAEKKAKGKAADEKEGKARSTRPPEDPKKD
jgi:hypothetical protein